MSDQFEQDDKQIDDQLAEFADQALLPDQVGQPGESRAFRLSALNTDLRGWQETVLALKRVIEDGMPDATVAGRICSRLQAEWYHYYPKHIPEGHPHLEEGKRPMGWLARLFLSSRQRTFAMGFALATLSLVLAALLFSPVVGIPVTGAAGGGGSWLFVLIILGAVFLVGVYWIIRSRH